MPSLSSLTGTAWLSRCQRYTYGYNSRRFRAALETGPPSVSPFSRRFSAEAAASAVAGMQRDLPIRQCGRLVIDLAKSNSAVGNSNDSDEPWHVTVTTAWQEHCDVLAADPALFSVHVDEESQQLTITSTGTGNREGSTASRELRVVTPERFGLVVAACSDSALHLHVQNKMEGDLSVSCARGYVSLDKVRGSSIVAHVGDAPLQSSSLVEGALVSLRAASLVAKKLNGEQVLVDTSGAVTAQAMYVTDARVTAGSDLIRGSSGGSSIGPDIVDIGLVNGALSVHCAEGNVRLANMDGWFDVLAERGHVNLQVNALKSRAGSGINADAAAAAAGGSGGSGDGVGCRARTLQGNLMVSVDPAVNASMSARATNATSRGRVSVVSDTWQPQEVAGQQGETKGDSSPARLLAVGRFAAAAAAATKEAGLGLTSGKVNLGAAAAMAAAMQHAEAVSEREEQTLQQSSSMPDLLLEGHGHVRVESLSWIEVIRRKHGFGGDTSKGPPAAGRTASHRDVARAIQSEQEQQQRRQQQLRATPASPESV